MITAAAVVLIMLVVTWVVTDHGPERGRPTLGDVRIEKIDDFQLPTR